MTPCNIVGAIDVPKKRMITTLLSRARHSRPGFRVSAAFLQGNAIWRPEHVNLLDFELGSCALRRSGYDNCEKVNESRVLERFPDFLPRNHD